MAGSAKVRAVLSTATSRTGNISRASATSRATVRAGGSAVGAGLRGVAGTKLCS